MINDLVSIIVPIYNVEEYIDECVDSLIRQDYSNIEILLVDDGSTDQSGKIADKFAKNNEKVYSFHKKNGGLSSARNYGLKKAKGKYICFVDSDDYVKKDYVSSMHNNIISNKTMIASCGYCHLKPDGNVCEINFQNIKKKYFGDDAQIYLNIIGYFNVSACNKMFDKSLFNDIEFPIGKKSEDWFIMYKLIEKSNSIYYDSDSKYIYRQRKGSITKGSRANYDAIEAATQVFNYFRNNENVSKYAAQSLAFAIIGIYNYELCNSINKENLNKLLKMERKYYKYLTYKHLSFNRKCQLFIFNYCNSIYNYIFKIYDLNRKKEAD